MQNFGAESLGRRRLGNPRKKCENKIQIHLKEACRVLCSHTGGYDEFYPLG
jgi:hypothetical protein